MNKSFGKNKHTFISQIGRVYYPGVEFNETFLNMKILDDWLN